MSDGRKDAFYPFPLFGTIAKSSGRAFEPHGSASRERHNKVVSFSFLKFFIFLLDK